VLVKASPVGPQVAKQIPDLENDNSNGNSFCAKVALCVSTGAVNGRMEE